jgi:hypothetical protein
MQKYQRQRQLVRPSQCHKIGFVTPTLSTGNLYCPSTLLSYQMTAKVTNPKLLMCQALRNDVMDWCVFRICIATCLTIFNTASFSDENTKIQSV